MSLVVIAAILASLAVMRYRHDGRQPEPQPPPEEPASAASEVDLNGIRAAGF